MTSSKSVSPFRLSRSNREGALFTFTMAMTAILRGNLYYVYGHLPLKMAAIAMIKVNNALSLLERLSLSAMYKILHVHGCIKTWPCRSREASVSPLGLAKVCQFVRAF